MFWNKRFMKEKNYKHILNWDQITKSHDYSIQQINNNDQIRSNKGILFEDLVEKLLKAIFPNEIWLRTAQTHDGKRDFVFPADKFLPEQKWIECKNYSSNVSLNVISPTLIMGAIDDIECIYFFSYSALNDNAIEGLIRYSASSGKKIKVFDGILLESLICQYHTKADLDVFFPNTDFDEAYKFLEAKQLRIVRLIKDMNGNAISPEHLFELGESFYINIIVQNVSPYFVEYDLKLTQSKKNTLLFDNNTCKNGLPFGEIKEHNILCHAINPGILSYYIEISSKIRDKKEGDKLRINGKIRIIDEPFLFWTGENALQVLDNCKKHLNEYNNEPLIIAAESGVGKSTLINILMHENSVANKYTILKFDLNLTRNYCARNLYCQAFGVQENDETPLDQIEDDNIALSLLVNGYAESAKMIAQTIMRLYNSERPYLFVIDDVQTISRSYIDLIGELNIEAEKSGKTIYYLLVLNTDKLSIEDFFDRLNWNYNYNDCKFCIQKLFKFNSKDIVSFMKHKFGLTEIDDFFEGYNKSISPLELHSFTADLKNNHIISKIPGGSSYQIINKFKFLRNIDKILFSNISINNICYSLIRSDIPDFVLKYLYITGEINQNTRKKYLSTINELVIKGILKDCDGRIVFRHERIRNGIGEKLLFSEEDYADIFYDEYTDINSKAICAINQINRIHNADTFLNDFFGSNHDIRKVNQRYNICWAIFDHLDELQLHGIVTKAVSYVRSNIERINLEQDYEKFFEFLRHIVDSAQTFMWDINAECVENMSYFIKKFFDRALSTYNNQIFNEYYPVLNELLLNTKNISYERKCYWLSHYSNRAAIVLDRKSEPLIDEPHCISELYARSEYYCKEAGNCDELLLQISIDNFNRHYIYRHDLTLSIVNKILINLLNLDRNKITRLTCLDYHLHLLEYLRLKLGECNCNDCLIALSDLKKKIIETRQNSHEAFYTLKMFILEIYISIDLSNYSEASNLLSEAFEFANRKGMRRSIYKLTYIRAHLLQFAKSPDLPKNIYTQMNLALEQFIDTKGQELNDVKREIFIANRLLKIVSHAYTKDHVLEIIRRGNKEVFKTLQGLLEKTEDEKTTQSKLVRMQSYFVLCGISFPTI